MGKKRSSNGVKNRPTTSSINTSSTTGSPALVAADIGDTVADGLYVDPVRIRFQHSRIRPVFSGCGRSVEGTLEEIRQGTTMVSDLPPIQVIVGPSGNTNMGDPEEPWYFSLNNRRLWVLKRLREDGLLEPFGNKVFVRVRTPKSQQERERYCVENCALEAKILPEKSHKIKGSSKKKSCSRDRSENGHSDDNLLLKQHSITISSNTNGNGDNDGIIEDEYEEEEEGNDSNDDLPSNRFGAFLLSD